MAEDASNRMRSANMAAIRSVETAPELYVRRALHAAGFRFRLHKRALPGNPDVVLARLGVAVFVHGCFWHGHGCARDHSPKTNPAYWSEKIRRNQTRDQLQRARLKDMGWVPIVVWECELESATASLLRTLARRRLKLAHPDVDGSRA